MSDLKLNPQFIETLQAFRTELDAAVYSSVPLDLIYDGLDHVASRWIEYLSNSKSELPDEGVHPDLYPSIASSQLISLLNSFRGEQIWTEVLESPIDLIDTVSNTIVTSPFLKFQDIRAGTIARLSLNYPLPSRIDKLLHLLSAHLPYYLDLITSPDSQELLELVHETFPCTQELV
jgi:hypothetical protein